MFNFTLLVVSSGWFGLFFFFLGSARLVLCAQLCVIGATRLVCSEPLHTVLHLS